MPSWLVARRGHAMSDKRNLDYNPADNMPCSLDAEQAVLGG